MTEEESPRRDQVRKWYTNPNVHLGELTFRDFQEVAAGVIGDGLASESFRRAARDCTAPFTQIDANGALALGIPVSRTSPVDVQFVESAPAFIVRGFTSVVGACLSVASAHDLAHWIHIDTDSQEFELVKTGRFTIHLIERKRVVASQSIDFSKNRETFARFNALTAALGAWRVEIPERETFRLVVAGDHFFSRLRTAVEKLCEGWAHHRENVLQHLCDSCDGVRDYGLPSGEPPEHLKLFVEHARRADPVALIAHMEELHERDPQQLFRLFENVTDFSDWARNGSEGPNYACELLIHACDAFFAAPHRSRCGRQLPWFDPTDSCLRSLPLAPEKMPEPGELQNYWGSLWGYMPFRYAGRVLQSADQPFDDSEETDFLELAQLPRVTDAEEATATAQSLLSVAVANKRWTIPPGAILEVAFGPFTHFQAWEFADSCVFVCRTADGRFSVVEVFARTGEITISFPLYSRPDVDEPDEKQVRAAIDLLFAAFVHDFFVLENRERVFETRSQRRAPPGCVAPSDGPVIIYLPRRRYLQKPDTDRCTRQLALTTRRPHMVAAHLRKAAGSSDLQRALAMRHGFSVPAGYTFVRPHERGAGERDVVYRSRSATWLLYDTEEPTQEYEGSDWFRFERDVHALMDRLGFAVEHVSVGRRGDNGVDLYATSHDDVAWVVQCKCFATGRKVTPSIVRELLGTITQYPEGTRGMLVTTSTFTGDAAHLAERAGIELIDGRRFAELRESLAKAERPR